MVISPLFEKPSLIEGVCGGSWSEIQEALKERQPAVWDFLVHGQNPEPEPRSERKRERERERKRAPKDELADLIRRESDAWRAFIQSHADMVSKDSLKIIQRVLRLACTDR